MPARSYVVTLSGGVTFLRPFRDAGEAKSWTELQLLTRPGYQVRWSAHNYTGETFLLATVVNQFGLAEEVGAATIREAVS